MPTVQAPSPQYGAGVAQQKQMQALPMGPAPTPQPAPLVPQPQPAQPVPLVGLDAPTQRPDEHVMAGSPSGPGPGPEALGSFAQPQGTPQTVGDFLTRLAALPGAPSDIQALAALAQSRS